MRHLLLFLYVAVAVLLWQPRVLADCRASAKGASAVHLLHTVAHELSDAADRAAMEQLIRVFTEHGCVTDQQATTWVLLTFSREGRLTAVTIHPRLLELPPLIQHAVILHELQHILSAPVTRRRLEAASRAPLTLPGPGAGAEQKPSSRFQRIVRILVEDEAQAYRRDLLYVFNTIQAAGGLTRYLAHVTPSHRAVIAQYYRHAVHPLVARDGTLDEQRLYRDFVFLRTFPRRYPHYYESALMWEVLQGHAAARRTDDGTWQLSRLMNPQAFLAWLAPKKILADP